MEDLRLRLQELRNTLVLAQDGERRALELYQDALDQYTKKPTDPEARNLQKTTSDAYTKAITTRTTAQNAVDKHQTLIDNEYKKINDELLAEDRKLKDQVNRYRAERDQALARAETAQAALVTQPPPATDGATGGGPVGGAHGGAKPKTTEIKTENQEAHPRLPQIQPQAPAPAVNPVQMQAVQGGQLSTIPVFTGELPFDVEGWIALVERAQAQFNWSDGQVSAVVKNKLSGLASTWLRAQEKLNLPGFDTWAAHPNGFKKLFEGKYLPHKTEQAAILAVSHLQQKATEKVSDFFDRVVLAVDKVNHHTTDAEKRSDNYRRMFATQVQTFFAAGMKQEIRQIVLGSNSPPTSMEALRDQAIATETQISNKPITMKELVEVTEDNTDDKQQQGQMNEILKQLEALSTQQKRIARSPRGRYPPRDLSRVTCYRCGLKGHYSPQCQLEQRSYIGNRGTRGNRGRGMPRGYGKRPPFRRSQEVYAEDNTFNQGN